jgi:Protein of unknown function (DUF3592)
VFVVAFLGIFVVAGIAIGYFMSFRPLSLAYQARSWTTADCEVISSRVVRNDDTARPDIRYRYQIDDRRYTSDRYNFIPGSTNDSTVGSTVERYAPGTRFQCYVDPADPTQAVINRDVTYWYYLGLIFCAAFAGIPLLVGTFAVRRLSATRAARPMSDAPLSAGPLDGGPIATVADFGPAVLQPSASPMGKLITATIVCLIWNGIVGVFTFFEIREFGAGGGGSWFMAIFLLLFQIIGVALLLTVPYQLLALANPRPAITLSRGTLPIGGAVPFEWQLTGAASRVTRLTVTLKGREEARYRRGTDTRTDTHVFHSAVLAEATDPMSIERGSGTIRIPAGTMHSFSAYNNKIIWTLTVKGEISRWPDVDESFDVTVSPA